MGQLSVTIDWDLRGCVSLRDPIQMKDARRHFGQDEMVKHNSNNKWYSMKLF